TMKKHPEYSPSPSDLGAILKLRTGGFVSSPSMEAFQEHDGLLPADFSSYPLQATFENPWELARPKVNGLLGKVIFSSRQSDGTSRRMWLEALYNDLPQAFQWRRVQMTEPLGVYVHKPLDILPKPSLREASDLFSNQPRLTFSE